MFAATFRSLLAHRARLVLTALAIALGTAFMAGSFVFTATLSRSLDSLFAQSAAGTDVIVQHATPPGANFGAGSGSAKPVPASIASIVRAVAGVAADDGVVSGRAVLLGRDGKPLPGQFAVALSWPQDSPILNLITALLVLAVIIALLGIASTLALSVTERTRELGLLRAVGMRRGQVARMIAGESVIIAIIGALTGTVLGLGLGAALAAAFTRSQQLTVVVPGGQVAAYVAAAAFAGLLAALAPARRAARMNMIAALAAE